MFGCRIAKWYNTCTVNKLMQTILDKIKSIHWLDRRIILIVVIVILVLLMMDFNNRMTNMLELNQQESALQTKVAQLEQTKVQVEARIAYATSEAAFEEWAREDDRLINEGDYPIILLPAGGATPTPTPLPDTPQQVLSNLQIWQKLLFGDR